MGFTKEAIMIAKIMPEEVLVRALRDALADYDKEPDSDKFTNLATTGLMLFLKIASASESFAEIERRMDHIDTAVKIVRGLDSDRLDPNHKE